VQVAQYRRDMVVSRRTMNQSGGSIEDRLQTVTADRSFTLRECEFWSFEWGRNAEPHGSAPACYVTYCHNIQCESKK